MHDSKYYSLYLSLKESIESGLYQEHERLPSKRQTADKTGYSLLTVEHAYNLLVDEGYLYTVEKKGYFVSPLDFSQKRSKKALLRHEHLPEPHEYSHDAFAFDAWFSTVRKVISDNDSRLFLKAPNKGCEVLRNALSDYLLRYRGMSVDPKAIIIGSGAEQLYETIIKLLGRDKIFGIEDPGYAQIGYVYHANEIHTEKLKMGNDGIESEELKAKQFDVLHVTPFHSVPTGITTSISKKLEYGRWAERVGGYIIEDDFDSEFFLPGQPIQTLFELDHTGSVIYVNTFSKSLSPSMRIGYMILPERLVALYDEKLGKLSCPVPVMDQYILAEFISSGGFERHLHRMRKQLKSK